MTSPDRPRFRNMAIRGAGVLLGVGLAGFGGYDQTAGGAAENREEAASVASIVAPPVPGTALDSAQQQIEAHAEAVKVGLLTTRQVPEEIVVTNPPELRDAYDVVERDRLHRDAVSAAETQFGVGPRLIVDLSLIGGGLGVAGGSALLRRRRATPPATI